MKCEKCGEKMIPIDTVESPIHGETVVTEYECPNNCDYLQWLETHKLGGFLWVGHFI